MNPPSLPRQSNIVTNKTSAKPHSDDASRNSFSSTTTRNTPLSPPPTPTTPAKHDFNDGCDEDESHSILRPSPELASLFDAPVYQLPQRDDKSLSPSSISSLSTTTTQSSTQILSTSAPKKRFRMLLSDPRTAKYLAPRNISASQGRVVKKQRKPLRPHKSPSKDEQDGYATVKMLVYETYLQNPRHLFETAQSYKTIEQRTDEVIVEMPENEPMSPLLDSKPVVSEESVWVKEDSRTTSKKLTLDYDHIHVMEPIGPVNVFETMRNIPRVSWKGHPLSISDLPEYSSLHPHEVAVASTLRLTPEQYLTCKRILILASREYAKQGRAFRKSDAQKLCRVDVNKTSRLWEWFSKVGWLSGVEGE